ncbi:hypothetical protein [Reichenbachiella sp.]
MKSRQYKLESDLSIDEFKARLKETTSPEKIFQLVTTYDFSHRPFCGKFDENTFHLKKNTFWRHLKSTTIIGKYSKNGDAGTSVLYSVGLSKPATILFYLLFIIIIIGLNTLFFIKNVRESEIYLMVNGWVLFMFLFGFFFCKISRFIVNQKFKTVFEIDVKPTDRYGYGKDTN